MWIDLYAPLTVILAGLVLASTVLTASGCGGECGVCRNHDVRLGVRSTEGGPVSNVQVAGFGVTLDCEPAETETLCRTGPGGVSGGDYTVMVQAPGFRTETLMFELPDPNAGAGCGCNIQDVDELVELQPE